MVIVGGGTAGWFTAAWFSNFMPGIDITLVESPNIPKIGVGESTTPQVSIFLDALGIDKKDFLKSTGSTYKIGTKFTNWRDGHGEQEFNSFTYPTDVNLLLNEVIFPTSWDHWGYQKIDISSSDAYIKLLSEHRFDKFDKNFHSQYHYMVNNTMPFNDDGSNILNPLYSSTYHINAESTADYVRDNIGIPNGVKHVRATVKEVIIIGDNTEKIILDDGTELTANLFVDASGFRKVLVNSWPVKEYKNHLVNSAWVCQLDYSDPGTEMVNYTISEAQDYGWLFKLGLYHRMGCGYCFNSNMISEENAKIDYLKLTSKHRFDPKLIKWNPSRLEYFGKGNTVAIGLSGGFVDPMEGNALYIVVNAIVKLSEVISEYFKTGVYNFYEFNNILTYSIDDIADFILIHYTLSSRSNSEMWKFLREFGAKENHIDLVYEKFTSKKNTMSAAIDGYTTFPNYVWAQWAHHMGIDISSWIRKDIDKTKLSVAELYFEHLERKNRIISQTRQNSYLWYKANIFND